MEIEQKQTGRILFEQRFISEDMLQEALKNQEKSGQQVARYLLEANFITEKNLAKCVSNHLGIPYIPLRAYDIPEEIIKIISVDLARKYWLIPLDRMKDVITVVMVDPLDTKAVREVESSTGYKVQTFVGIASDILKAIEYYYGVDIKEKKLKGEEPAPLSVKDNIYDGPERRRSVRLNAKIDIHFPEQDYYRKSQIKNVSRHGILFESKNILPLDAFVILQINLPKNFSSSPIAAVARVVRTTQLGADKFDIGAELVKIPKEDMQTIIDYARRPGDSQK